MVRALEKDGVTAHICTTNDNGPSLLDVPVDQWIEYQGARVLCHQRWSPSISPLREFQYASGFPNWLEEVLPDYDGVHIHAVFSYLSTRAMTICRRLGRPYIVRPLGQLDSWSLNQKALKKQLYFRIIERKNLCSASAIHCTSPTEAGNVRQLFPEMRIAVIPHGIEPSQPVRDAAARIKEKYNIPGSQKVLLFLSRWAPKKNIPLLLDALALMPDPSWKLILAGSADAAYSKTVHEGISERGLAQRVICPGHVQGEDKSLLLAGADAFVLPSITENFGVAVAEALCAGLPCVVSEGVDIASSVVALKGGLVSKLDAHSLASTLQSLPSASQDRDRLSRDAQAQFSWTASAQLLKNLYVEVFSS